MNIRSLNLKYKLAMVLFIVMCIYTSVLVHIQSIAGVNYWDIFIYLQNSMLFAHINIGSQLSVPPVLSLLVSIPFRLGFISEITLFSVSGVLFTALVVGIYLLFNRRFDPVASFIGSLIFSMLSLVVTWAVSGSTDLPSLTFAVYALLFTIYAVDGKFSCFYVSFIFFTMAFFTRFTVGFILVVILAYIMMNYAQFRKQTTRKSLRNLFIFMILSCAAIALVYLVKQNSIPFLSQFMEVSSSGRVSSVNIGYDLNPLYYIRNMPQFIASTSVSPDYDTTMTSVYNRPSIVSYIILTLTVAGIADVFYRVIKDVKSYDKTEKTTLLLTAIIVLFTIFTYTHITYLVTELLFITALMLLYNKFKLKFNQYDILMILWMGIFMIMHSYHPVKVDRYIIATFIPIIYFMIKTVEITLKNRKKTITALLILLIILIPVNAGYLNSTAHPNTHTTEEKKAAQWLEKYDEKLNTTTISSDRGVSFSWYLKKYTYTTIPRVLTQNNRTLTDTLKSINATYYIDSTSNTDHIKGYHIIYNNNKTKNKLKIYQKNT